MSDVWASDYEFNILVLEFSRRMITADQGMRENYTNKPRRSPRGGMLKYAAGNGRHEYFERRGMRLEVSSSNHVDRIGLIDDQGHLVNVWHYRLEGEPAGPFGDFDRYYSQNILKNGRLLLGAWRSFIVSELDSWTKEADVVDAKALEELRQEIKTEAESCSANLTLLAARYSKNS
jgi:hypothetical protein